MDIPDDDDDDDDDCSSNQITSYDSPTRQRNASRTSDDIVTDFTTDLSDT